MNLQLHKPFFRFFSALKVFFPTIFIKYFTFLYNFYSPLRNVMVKPILLILAKVTKIAIVEMQYLEIAFQIFQTVHAHHYCFSLWGVAGCYT